MFDLIFDKRLNRRGSKQKKSIVRIFEGGVEFIIGEDTPSCALALLDNVLDHLLDVLLC